MIGDPLDVKMFESTKWILGDSKPDDLSEAWVYPKELESTQSIKIIKWFDFNSHNMWMSSITREELSGKTFCFVKGSPEKIYSLCLPNSLPSDFE